MNKLKVTYDQLVREAKSRIKTIPPVMAMDMAQEDDVLVVDVRDIRELTRDGCIPDSVHAPRGLIESWVDPESEYYKSEFGDFSRFLIVCASGRRSALVADSLQQMGFGPVFNMDGGFAAWELLDGDVSTISQARHKDLFDPEDQLVRL